MNKLIFAVCLWALAVLSLQVPASSANVILQIRTLAARIPFLTRKLEQFERQFGRLDVSRSMQKNLNGTGAAVKLTLEATGDQQKASLPTVDAIVARDGDDRTNGIRRCQAVKKSFILIRRPGII